MRCLIAVVTMVLALQVNAFEYGWNELPDTKIRDQCPVGKEYAFQYHCKAVTNAWSGGAYDTKRGRLYMWGGGHADYKGNEIYVLDINTPRLLRLTDPAFPLPIFKVGVTESELAPYDGTQPNGRHTYDGMNYLPEPDKLWAWSGSLSSMNGGNDNWVWIFNPEKNTWKHIEPTGDIPEGASASVSAYNSNDGKAYVHNRKHLYSYEYNDTGGLWVNHTPAHTQYLHLEVTAEIDPNSNRFYIFGKGEQTYYDLTDFSRHELKTTGWDNIPPYVGLAYDPIEKTIVGLDLDGSLYYLDQTKMHWNRRQSAGAPSINIRAHGRFAYDPGEDVFIWYGLVDENGWIFKPVRDGSVLTPPSTPSNIIVLDKGHRTVVSWDESSSDAGISYYVIYRDGVETGTSTKLDYPDDTVVFGQTYTYTVKAMDVTEKSSDISKKVSVTIASPIPITPAGDCSRNDGRNDLIMCETFDNDKWWSNWDRAQSKTNPSPATDKQSTDIVSEGCVTDNCLAVHMLKDETIAINMAWPLSKNGVHTDQAFLSYDIKFGPNWNPDSCYPETGEYANSGGKFPGLADPRQWPEKQCGNGGASSDGINCWSARSQFGKPLYNRAITRFGSYLYHPNQESSTGDVGYWDDGQSSGGSGTSCENNPAQMTCGMGRINHFENNKWYRVEVQIRMNTPGHANGILRGWVNDVLAYEKINMEWRKPGHDDLHVRLVWFNVYKGGMIGGCRDGDVFFDNLVVARDAPLSRALFATPRYRNLTDSP